MNKQIPFKKRFNLQERSEKSKRQMSANPGKIVIYVQKQPKSTLPSLANPRFLCEKQYKFIMIKNMLEKKIREAGSNNLGGENSFFLYVNGILPNPETAMSEIYEKYKDEDGFLYMEYNNQAVM